MRLAALVIAVAACHGSSDPPPTLEAYVADLAGADLQTASAAVASWKLDADAWARVTTDPYRGMYADYALAFDAAAPALAAQLAHAPRGARVHARAHYAGDPRLTLGQARARWAQPVQAPSQIVEIGGAPFDAVFVRDRDRWRVIAGVDAMIRARALPMDERCSALLDAVLPGPCSDASWVVAEAALRGDRARFQRACALAANLCHR